MPEQQEKIKQPIGLKRFQEKVLQLVGGDEDKAKIAEKYADLEMDFEYVKDLNTQLANKYQELMESFPTQYELDLIIFHLQKTKETYVLNYDKEQTEKRLTKLIKFRSALAALERQDLNVMPPKYEDLVTEDDNKETQVSQ